LGLAFWLLGSLGLGIYERGTRLPELSLRNAAGESVQLADFRGRPLVINLWASWCPPCRREMPVLQQAQAENPDVVFLFANQGESAETVRHFLQGENLRLDNLLAKLPAVVEQQVVQAQVLALEEMAHGLGALAPGGEEEHYVGILRLRLLQH
ncbi:TlpA family protein disulfide reductase, partial [Pseudomonas aeruginosa]